MIAGTCSSFAILDARSRRSPAISSYVPPGSARTTSGCSTPFASIDSASASSDSPLNSLRGWSGFGRISSTGIWRRPGSASSGREFPGRIAARPRPMPRDSATGGHLLCEFEIRERAGTLRVVQRDRHAVARGFADADVAGDDRVEDELGEVLTQLALDVGCQARATVVHGDDHPGHG